MIKIDIKIKHDKYLTVRVRLCCAAVSCYSKPPIQPVLINRPAIVWATYI
jgi:hypothetical protein